MQRISPEASTGLIMFEASIEPPETARASRVLFVFRVGQDAARAVRLRDSVREVVEYVEARDALLLQKVDGVRVGRLVERREDVAAVNLTLAGAFGLHERVLDDALEGRRVFRQRLA